MSALPCIESTSFWDPKSASIYMYYTCMSMSILRKDTSPQERPVGAENGEGHAVSRSLSTELPSCPCFSVFPVRSTRFLSVFVSLHGWMKSSQCISPPRFLTRAGLPVVVSGLQDFLSGCVRVCRHTVGTRKSSKCFLWIEEDLQSVQMAQLVRQVTLPYPGSVGVYACVWTGACAHVVYVHCVYVCGSPESRVESSMRPSI